jgi:uroporphyrinogen decarboxylase
MVRIDPDIETEKFRPYLGIIPVDTNVSYWGIGQKLQKTQEGWPVGYRYLHPLANVDTIQELEQYPFPELSSSDADAGLEQKVYDLKKDGYAVLGQMSQTILETAYLMRGYERLMVDFYERPRYVDLLFQRIAEQRLFQARRFAEAGVDILRIGDDIAMQTGLMVSPALYRERIKPWHSSVIEEARRINPKIVVFYHSDGQLMDLLPDLIDIGVNIINPVQPECMDLEKVKCAFGEQLVLWGCMPVQSVFAHGSRCDVRRHLEFLMEKIALDGGLIVQFMNFMITDRSLENLRVFFEIFYEFGKYD